MGDMLKKAYDDAEQHQKPAKVKDDWSLYVAIIIGVVLGNAIVAATAILLKLGGLI